MNRKKMTIITMIILLTAVLTVLIFYKNKGETYLVKYSGKLPDFKYPVNVKKLLGALEQQITWFKKNTEKTFNFGNRKISSAQMTESLLKFKEIIMTSENEESLKEIIKRYFDIYVLNKGHGKTLLTSYYSPVYKGNLTRTDEFKWPIYKMPDDAFFIQTNDFDSLFLKPGEARTAHSVVARIDSASKKILPYFTREEIDNQNALAGKNLEIVYLKNYLDQFLLHIQGGGFIELPDSTYLKLNFAGKNSHPYKSIGKILVDEGKIAKEEINLETIKEYFEKNPEDIHRVCNINKSYVFYEKADSVYQEISSEMAPYGSLNFPVTEKVSLACDKKYFPGGELAFLVATGEQTADTLETFVIDQDTGGAITENHFDFYAGIGEEAGRFAGTFFSKQASLYFLVLKKEHIERK